MRVTVIVPARDEADVLPRCLGSLLATEAAEILVVDGGSTDSTGAIAASFAARDPRIRVLDEPPLPDGWVGKCWACWTGRQAATGDVLLFTDADTAHAPDSIRDALAQAGDDAELVTGLAVQELPTFAERVVMPPIFSLIRTAAGEPDDRALADPARAIANGQFLLVRAEAYDRVGGHAAPEVRGTVVEDLAFARLAASRGLRARFVELRVRVRMYRSLRGMWEGWRKNVAAGAARTPPMRFVATALAFALGALAVPVALAAAVARAWPLAAGGALAWLAMSAFVRRAQTSTEGPSWRHALLHPLGYWFFGAVLAASAFDRLSGRGARWKGRRYRS